MPRPRLSDEERRQRRKLSNAKYNLKRGHIPGAVGKPSQNKERTVEIVNGITVVKEKPRQIVLSRELPPNPTADDMKQFVIEMARSAADIGSAPAMIAAAQTLQKEIDRWERSRPPEITPPKPRPRIPVEIEISSVKCPHCGKTFEV